MSDIDKRVVQFEFENKKFERNVKQSKKSLEELKESLDFERVSKSLDKVSVRFGAFEVAAVTALSNITNRVVDLGINLIKSLSVDNISAGWVKFGDKTVSVATMMAQNIKIAGREIENTSEKFEIINEQLDKLNWFTDETSYNFTDMVDSIGKFTAAGQDLDASVEAMMGIANWAALSGQNASTASRAMYQLAQAMGKGYVQLIDYKSIQNANMDTQEFRQTILDTAVAMGELTKQGENYITKSGSKFTKNQFAEQLSSKWLTSGVLTKSLGKYSAAVDKLYEITQREGITASEAIKKYSNELDVFGLKAFKAAQEARTFEDVINSVKDAVSTGWMTTAENIFGNYLESKELWTDLANELYDVFAEGGNFRNEVLSLWRDLGGYADLFKHGDDEQGAFWNIYDSVIAVRDIIKDSINTIFPASIFSGEADQIQDFGEKLKTFTEGLRDITAQVLYNIRNSERFGNILSGILAIFRFIANTIYAIRYAVDPLITAAKDIADELITAASNLGVTLASSDKLTSRILNFATKINSVLTKIVEFINPRGLIRKGLDIITAIVSGLDKIFDSLATGGVTFESAIDGAKNAITRFASAIGSLFEKVKSLGSGSGGDNKGGFFERILAVFAIEKEDVQSISVTQALLDIVSNILASIQSAVQFITVVFKSITDAIRELVSLVDESLYSQIHDTIVAIGSIVPATLNLLLGIVETTANLITDLIDWYSELSTSMKIAVVAVGIITVLQFLLLKKLIPSVTIAENISKFAGRWATSKWLESIASIIESIAKVLFSITAGIAVIALLPKDNLAAAISVMSAIFVTLIGAVITMVTLAKNAKMIKYTILKETSDSPLYAIARILTTMSFVITSIAVALLAMRKMDAKQIYAAGVALGIILGSIGGIMAVIMVMMKTLKGQKSDAVETRFKEIRKTISALASSLLIIAVSLGILGYFANKIADIPMEAIKKTIVLLSSMALMLAALAYLSQRTDAKAVKKTVALLASVALALRYLVKTASIAKQVDWESFGKVGALAAGLTIMVAALAAIGKFLGGGQTALVALSIIELAVALGAFVIVLQQLQTIEWDTIWKGMGLLAVTLVILGAASLVAPSIAILGAGILAFGIGLLSAAYSVIVFVDAIHMIMDLLTVGTDTIVASLDEFTVVIKAALENLLEIVVYTISLLVNGVLDILINTTPKLIELISVIISEVLTMFRENGPKWLDDILVIFIEGLKVLNNRLPELVEQICTFIKTAFISTLTFLKGNSMDLIAALFEFVLKLLLDVSRYFKEHAWEWGEAFVEIGINLVRGLVEGILGAGAAIWDACKDVGGKVIDWFKGVFKIKSPSKVTEEMGRYLDEGLAVGIEKNVDDLTKDATNSMTKVISAIGDTIEDGINEDELTITPVLDLSNVQAGTRDISGMMSSISGRSISMSGSLATTASGELARSKAARLAAQQNQNGNVTNNNQTDTYNVTFNITTDDPEELARETDKILQRRRLNSNLAKGGV